MNSALNSQHSTPNNVWAKGIIAAFVAFAAFIIVLVTICMKQDISLDSKEYYKEELVYQKKIDGMSNTQQLKQTPKIQYVDKDQKLLIDFVNENSLYGKIQFYKPDKSKEDFDLDFAKNLSVDMSKKAKGLWKLKINWTQNGKDFYYEEPVFVN